MFKNVGFAITGSFCTHERILTEIKKLVDVGYNVIPIVSETVAVTNTRFGKAEDLLKKLKNVTKNNVISTITGAEVIGPNNLIDVLIIAPCTGNTVSKLANAITDTSVTMVAKSHVRNNKPVIVAISSNDFLGNNMINLAKLMAFKNYYLVPFGQDDFSKKPKSLVADFSLIEKTMLMAEQNKQIQPILINLK